MNELLAGAPTVAELFNMVSFYMPSNLAVLCNGDIIPAFTILGFLLEIRIKPIAGSQISTNWSTSKMNTWTNAANFSLAHTPQQSNALMGYCLIGSLQADRLVGTDGNL